jgi:hypothetical protein
MHSRGFTHWLMRWLMLSALLLISMPAAAQDATEGDTVPRELVLRLLSHPGHTRPQDLSLFIGELPHGLELPLPEEMTVVGGTRDVHGATTVVLDTTLSASDALRVFQERLTEEGWTAFAEQPYGRREIFVPSPTAGHQEFCRTGEHLGIAASEAADETDVRLCLYAGAEHHPCGNAEAYGVPEESAVSDLVPSLHAPEGAQQRGAGYSGGGSSFLAETSLATDLTLSQVTEHYAAQLQAAGWLQDSAGENDARQWRLLSQQDGEARSLQLLLIVRDGMRPEEVDVALAGF